jgi:two-component system CheB/CheR fusion protein
VDKSQHIYQRKETLGLEALQFPLGDLGAARGRAGLSSRRRRGEKPALERILKQVVLDEFTPACLAVDGQGDIRYYWGPVHRYIEVPSGPPTQAAVNLAIPSIRLELRAALHKASVERDAVVHQEAAAEVGDAVQHLDLVVRPLSEAGKNSDLVLVAFREIGSPRPRDGRPAPADAGQASLVEQLEGELRSTKGQLQSTVEELEGANEEMRSSNEELQSMNEELQSSNEELQTSQEELQSVNEELQTVNAELQRKVEELDAAHGDLQNLFQSTQIATLFLDPRLRVARFTPAATEIFRLIDSDVGRPITDLASRVPSLQLGTAVEEVIRKLQPKEMTVRLGDAPRWYLLRILPYRAMDGSMAGAVLTFTDISALKEAEEALRVSEERERARTGVLQALMDAVPAAIRIARDAQGREVVGNRAAYDLLRMEPGRNLSLSGPDAPAHFSIWRGGRRLAPEETALQVAAAEGKAVRDWEEDVVFADGTSVHLMGNVQPLRDSAGKPEGAVGVFLDITDRKRAEDALRNSEARFRSAVESFVDAFAIFSAVRDPQGAIVDFLLEYVNEAGARLGRAPRDQMVGRRLTALYPAAAASGLVAALSHLVESGEPFAQDSFEYQDLFGGEPLTRIFEFRAQKHEDGFAVAWRDATAQRRAERSLLEADRRKDEFLAILGHELRNPLAAIQSALHLARAPSVSPAESARMRAIMDRQLGQLERMVDDLLDVTRISRGLIQLRTEPVDLGALVRETVDGYRPAASDVELTAEVALRPLFVQGDKARLTQVLTNLLSNAAKFTPPGGRVLVALAEEPGVAVLSVLDSGLGLDDATRQHLFEPFAQGPQGLARSRGGLGLGLALVKRLVEMHGGSVSAASPGAGLGARFEVRLPLRLEQRSEASAAAPRQTRPRRVLVVEDGRDVADALSALLESAGHAVAVAYDGASALEKARTFRPELVLCDLGLPGAMDGYAVARAFRADPSLRAVPVVALSGYAGEENRRRALEAGFMDHVRKPAPLEVLEAAFDRFA